MSPSYPLTVIHFLMHLVDVSPLLFALHEHTSFPHFFASSSIFLSSWRRICISSRGDAGPQLMQILLGHSFYHSLILTHYCTSQSHTIRVTKYNDTHAHKDESRTLQTKGTQLEGDATRRISRKGQRFPVPIYHGSLSKD